MVWIRTPRVEAYACVACGWTFRPSGPPWGTSLDEMIRNFELQRDQEFAAHVCAQCPRRTDVRDGFKFSPSSDHGTPGTSRGYRTKCESVR